LESGSYSRDMIDQVKVAFRLMTLVACSGT